MALRGKQPEAVEKRLKMLMFGMAGAGKTTAAISFPAPYVIDTERGSENSQYLKLIKKNKGALFQSSDFSEIVAEIRALLTEKHDYKTLVIDPLTTVYNNLLDGASKNAKGEDNTGFGRHYQEANKQLKHLLNLLLRLDMNVIITAHAKNEYGANLNILGTTYDCYKKLDYLFDLVLEIKKLGVTRTGVVRKTRISTFDEFEEFEFSYVEVAKRYGKDILEKDAKAEEVATYEQVTEALRLVELLRVPADVVDKWFAKANAISFEEMNKELIGKCIDTMQEKIKGKEQK
jgi:hypothetical protein